MEETKMNVKEEGMFKPAINYGLIIAVSIIVISLVFYLAGHATSTIQSYIATVVLIAGLVYAAISYRKDPMGGFISYGQSLGFIVLTGLMASLIIAVYNYIFLAILAPDVMQLIREQAFEAAYETMLRINPNATDAEIDSMIRIQERIQTPFLASFFGTFFNVLIAFITGLIASIFIKRRNPEFPA